MQIIRSTIYLNPTPAMGQHLLSKIIVFVRSSMLQSNHTFTTRVVNIICNSICQMCNQLFSTIHCIQNKLVAWRKLQRTPFRSQKDTYYNPQLYVICSVTRPWPMDQWHLSTLASNSKVSGDHNQETALQISAGSSRSPLS